MKLEIVKFGNELNIYMPKELQTKEFAEEYIKLQNEFAWHVGKRIIVHFDNVLWIDNLAMIQLFLLLWNQKKNGKIVKFFVNITEESIEYFRFYKYLSDYGFLQRMKQIDSTFLEMDEEIKDEWLIQQLEKGDFNQSECLVPLQILDNYSTVNRFVCEVRDIFIKKYCNDFSECELDNFLFRMSVFLQETIGNVFEHAFERKEDAFCGVLVRFIHTDNHDERSKKEREYIGLQNEKDASEPFKRNGKFRIKNHIQLAYSKNPYRNKIGMQVMERYLQIFVVDIGMGLLESMNVSDPHKERNLLNAIFEKGIRSPKKARNTLVGGLGMLYQLFQEDENYISIKGEYNWISVACSKKRDTKGTLEYVHSTGIANQNVLKGFAIIGYLDCGYGVRPKFFVDSLTEIQNSIFTETYMLPSNINYTDFIIIDFRNRFPDLSTINNENRTILCFVGENIEKGVWANKINGLFAYKSQGNTLILVDIPDRELRKYELIFDRFSGNINTLIMLSCSLKLAIFSRNTSTKELVIDKYKMESYKCDVSKNITLSAKGLLNVMRQYDSKIFWEKVAFTQNVNQQKIFINTQIDWKPESGDTLDSYLDFSQISFNEDLVTLLMYQLFRLPQGETEKNYFISMDRFADDICEQTNGKLRDKIVSNITQKIYIGSVFVTGTSSELSKFNVEACQIRNEYYFFRHLLTNCGKDVKVKALLLWPNQALTDELFGFEESKEYARLAKTPFLAPSGTTYFAEKHYRDIGESVELKQDQSYKIFQNDQFWIKRLIKIVHTDMEDRHDFICLNAVSLFIKHYMESRHNERYVAENCFDYLLKEMYIALGRTKSTIDLSIKSDIEPEYQVVVKGKLKDCTVPAETGLFVYLADYETMEIVSKLKDIFSDALQKRIIPIAPVNKKRTASPLLISPILLESIREKIAPIDNMENKSQGIKRVTIFIASVTSTRLQRELKHILYRLGAKDIKCICLIDRQRFPLGSREKESYRSFAKVDLAVLGSDEGCKLCAGLKLIERLKTDLFSDVLKKRCNEIEYIWGKIKSSDSFYRRGVDVQRCDFSASIEETVRNICINDYKMENSIVINSDVGLVLFTLEQTSITVSLNFLMRCLQSEEIEEKIKVLLICSHLLIFGEDEIAVTDRRKLAIELYILLQKMKECNGYTALASITLLMLPTSEKSNLHKMYKEKWKMEHFNNIDFIIASIGMMLSSFMPQEKFLKYWVKNAREEQLDYLYGIFLLTDGNTATRHGTILYRMEDSGWCVSKMDYITAQNDVDFLQSAYEALPPSYFFDTGSYQKIQTQVIDILKKIRITLHQNIINDEGVCDRKELSIKIRDLFSLTKKLNKEIFMNTDIDSLCNLQNRIKWVAEDAKTRLGGCRINCHVEEISYDLQQNKKFFYFIEDLRREIMYLIEDFRHSDKQNPITGSDGKQYDGVVEIIFEEFKMSYLFKNHVKDSFSLEEVKRKKHLKYNRPTIMALRALYPFDKEFALFDYQYDDTSKTYTAIINIPYLGV